MRYYDIKIRDAKTNAITREFSSLDSFGKTIPGALNIELDFPVYPLAEPMGASYLRIWGISLKDIGQSSDFNNQLIEVYAGMAAGLPLANPKQAGLILAGTITQCFGNWQAAIITLDFVINAALGTEDSPANIVLNWKANTPLSAAIANTLATAFPTYKATISINPNLVLPHDEVHYCSTAVQFAQYLRELSADIIGGNYAGLDIQVGENTFNVYDGTTQTTPIAINFVDFIGQPTWIAFNQIQFKNALRADLNVGDYIKLPPSQVTTGAQSFSQYRNKSIFQGVFQISQVRHVGNFRQPNADSWVTNIEAFAV